jgi:hypothetical protein
MKNEKRRIDNLGLRINADGSRSVCEEKTPTDRSRGCEQPPADQKPLPAIGRSFRLQAAPSSQKHWPLLALLYAAGVRLSFPTASFTSCGQMKMRS